MLLLLLLIIVVVVVIIIISICGLLKDAVSISGYKTTNSRMNRKTLQAASLPRLLTVRTEKPEKTAQSRYTTNRSKVEPSTSRLIKQHCLQHFDWFGAKENI